MCYYGQGALALLLPTPAATAEVDKKRVKCVMCLCFMALRGPSPFGQKLGRRGRSELAGGGEGRETESGDLVSCAQA